MLDMMADLNENFEMEKNSDMSVDDDEVIEFLNPFKIHQQQLIDDFSLFLDDAQKCR